MRPTETFGRRTWVGKQRNLMQYFTEHNPRGWLRNRVQRIERQEATIGCRFCASSLPKTTKGAGAEYGSELAW